MGTSNEDIIKIVRYYQQRLERYASSKSEDKILHVLSRLDKVPIRTAHLESTGVGRTVNALKKIGGSVGEAAKALVTSWKEMVLDEENAVEEAEHLNESEEAVDSSYSSENEINNHHDKENEAIGQDGEHIEKEMNYTSSPTLDENREYDKESNSSISSKRKHDGASSDEEYGSKRKYVNNDDSDLEELVQKSTKSDAHTKHHSSESSGDEHSAPDAKKSKQFKNYSHSAERESTKYKQELESDHSDSIDDYTSKAKTSNDRSERGRSDEYSRESKKSKHGRDSDNSDSDDDPKNNSKRCKHRSGSQLDSDDGHKSERTKSGHSRNRADPDDHKRDSKKVKHGKVHSDSGNHKKSKHRRDHSDSEDGHKRERKNSKNGRAYSETEDSQKKHCKNSKHERAHSDSDNEHNSEYNKSKSDRGHSDSEDSHKTNSKKYKREKDHSDSEDDDKRKSKKSKYGKHHSDSDDHSREKLKKSVYGRGKDQSDSEEDSNKLKSKSSKHENESHKSKSRHKIDYKKQDCGSEEKAVFKPRNENKSKRGPECEENRTSSQHKSERKSKYPDNYFDNEKSKGESKSKNEKDVSKSNSSRLDKYKKDKKEKEDKKEKVDDKKKNDSKKDKHETKHSHKKEESSKHVEKLKTKDAHRQENSKKEKSSSEKVSKHGERSSSSKHKSTSSENIEKKNKDKMPKEKKTVPKDKIVNGIDSESGASFAEALGMCGATVINKPNSSSSSSSKKKSSSVLTSDKSKNDRSSLEMSSISSYKPEYLEPVEEEDNVPELLKESQLEPLNINLASLLPEITPNYRPLGISLDLQPKRMLTDDEALSRVMANKNQRTKVYSGNKCYGKVETLFDLCLRILQDNIDALEYTGGVPYSILKGILEKASPDQLFNMEHHNPYLIEDTDELWQLHCQKEFRSKKREELESWREMYMRCLDEREARLNFVKANIKQSQDKSIPVRTTKLAYIDSVVKPPRNIARKQAKNGIIPDKIPSPSTKLSALAKSGEAGKVTVPNPASRAAERSINSRSAAAVKSKKAPLMAKTLSFLKNRFKR